jgi:hypothetical protein
LISQQIPVMPGNPFELDPNAPIPKKEPQQPRDRSRSQFQSKKKPAAAGAPGGGNRPQGGGNKSGGWKPRRSN